MQNQQKQPLGPGDHLTPQTCTNIVYQLAACHATCFQVFLRKDFGAEAFGKFTGPGAFIMLILAAGADRIMMCYLWVWLIALLLQKARTSTNRQKGIIPHSRYNGFPAVAMKLFRSKTETQARTVEPVICLVAGIALMQVAETAGMFVAAGFVSTAIVEGSIRWIDHRKVQQMRDGQIDAERMSAMYRGEEF